ncbi:MAG: type II secretion system F family protein [Parvularculaceae bacterium]
MSDQTLIFAAVALILICGVAVFFALPSDASKAGAKRAAAITKSGKAKGGAVQGADMSKDRRKQVQETLKELEAKQKAKQKKLSLRKKLERAGLSMSPKTFYIFSGVIGVIAFLAGLVTGQAMIVALGMGFAGGLGLPRWVVSMLTKRRQKKFLDEFSNAIDVIVRGVKSGLPVNDSLRIIAKEAASPVREEFEEFVESIRIGVSMEQALERMFDRMPLPEVNFFSIVLLLQKSAGGNLSEALGNLASVLRSRKSMKGKIEAMSSEAKASAGIIGALPFLLAGMLFLLAPDYIGVMFTTPLGKLMLAGALGWMGIGVMVMRGMINFKF